MKKILVIDDRSESRELICLTLSETDFEIHEAVDGEEALKVAQQVFPDLMILDVMMPGQLDGFEVCRLIKEDKATRNIRVLLLTAKSHQEDLRKGGECGADFYMTKPFSPLELMERVDHLLED